MLTPRLLVQPICRTRSLIHFCFAYMKIYIRGFKARMSKKLLDTKDIHIIFQSMSSERMPECMDCPRL